MQGIKIYLQSKNLVPLWIKVFINCVRLQAIVAELHHTEGVALTCKGQKNSKKNGLSDRLWEKDIMFYYNEYITSPLFLSKLCSILLCDHSNLRRINLVLRTKKRVGERQTTRKKFKKLDGEDLWWEWNIKVQPHFKISSTMIKKIYTESKILNYFFCNLTLK